FWANRAPAQEIFVVPEVHYEPDHHPTTPAFLPKPRPEPAKHLPRRVANCMGMGCQDDYFYPTCGSWRYEMHFIFGSCRDFFREPCVPYQPCADHRYRR